MAETNWASTPKPVASSAYQAPTAGNRLLDIGRSTTIAAAPNRTRASRNGRGTNIGTW